MSASRDGRFIDERHCVADVAQPPRRVFFETPAQQRPNAGRNTVEIRRPLEHRRQCVGDGVACERPGASEHFEQHHAEGPDIGTLVDRFTASLLRRHVGGRAQDDANARER